MKLAAYPSENTRAQEEYSHVDFTQHKETTWAQNPVQHSDLMQQCYTPAQQKSRNKWLHTGCLYTETEQIPASLQDKIIAIMNYKTF